MPQVPSILLYCVTPKPKRESPNPIQKILIGVSGWAQLKSLDRRLGGDVARRPRWSRGPPAAPKARGRTKAISPRIQGVSLVRRARGEGIAHPYARGRRRSRG